MGAGAQAINSRRQAEIRETTSLVNTGLFTTTDPKYAGLTEGIRRERELSKERARQNAFLKAIRLGKFGQRSLLSGSFAGITDEAAAAAALGGTRPGASVGGAPSASPSIGGGGGGGGGITGRVTRYRTLMP